MNAYVIISLQVYAGNTRQFVGCLQFANSFSTAIVIGASVAAFLVLVFMSIGVYCAVKNVKARNAAAQISSP
jgi:hypothetical protein